MNRHYLLVIAFLLGSSFLSSCKQAMPTQNSNPQTFPSFQVVPSGDIFITVATGIQKDIRLTISNLTNDTIFLTSKFISAKYFTFYGPANPFRLLPKQIDSSVQLYFYALAPVNDTAILALKSSRGDSSEIRCIASSQGPSIVYLNWQAHLSITKLSVLDARTGYIIDRNGYRRQDTTIINYLWDGFTLRDSSASIFGNRLNFGYSHNIDQITSFNTDNDDESASLDITLDTNARIIIDAAVSFSHYTYHETHLASDPYSESNIQYSFHLKNCPYTIFTDSSFQCAIKGNQLAQSLVSFSYKNSSASNDPGNEISSDLSNIMTMAPPFDSSEIDFTLKK